MRQQGLVVYCTQRADRPVCLFPPRPRFILDSPTSIQKSLVDQEKLIQDEMDALAKKQKVGGDWD